MTSKAFIWVVLGIVLIVAPAQAGTPFEVEDYLSYIAGSVGGGALAGWGYGEFVIKRSDLHTVNPEKAIKAGAGFGLVGSLVSLGLLWGCFNEDASGKLAKLCVALASMLTVTGGVAVLDYLDANKDGNNLGTPFLESLNPVHLGGGAVGGLAAAIAGGVTLKLVKALWAKIA